MSEATVESGLRGFSFMPQNRLEVKLQYIEDEELERTWKANRRQRLKQQEQKIWEEFVKDQDDLDTLCKDDPYQFLEQLPESCLKELMEAELEKMKKEKASENLMEDQNQEGNGDVSRQTNSNDLVTVTFSEEVEKNDERCVMLHIFDDEKDDDEKGEQMDNDHSGAEDEALNESSSPCTVRERQSSPSYQSPPQRSPVRKRNKSPENVTNMIESSIYCAKIKDLRPKINNEMLAIINSLEQRDFCGIDPEELAKMCRRSTEFCARFNRIYMYQLHRQIHDIKRHNSVSLPFARHTQFQSQMVRIVSLHQNLLQSLQVCHRWVQQTACAGEGAALLHSVARVAGAVSALCRAVPAPHALAAAHNLYDDDLLATCEKLEQVITEFELRMTAFMTSSNNTESSRSKKSSTTGKKKRTTGTSSKSGLKKGETESRLSMYSLDTLRLSLHPKSSSSRDNQSGGTSKVRGGVSCNGRKTEAAANNQPPKSSRKSPRSRRPLMRAPGSGRGRAGGGGRAPRDADIRTMVEAVEPCTSSYMSREVSPRQSDKISKIPTPHISRNQTPRSAKESRKMSPEKAKIKMLSPRKPMSPKLRSPLKSIDPVPEHKSHAEDSPKILAKNKRSEGTQAVVGAQIKTPMPSPRPAEDDFGPMERDRCKTSNLGPARCEVTRIVRQLCGGDATGSRYERVSGAKNAQLHCISGGSPRQPSTPQLLRILEETIQKKVPKTLYQKPSTGNNVDRFRLALNIPEQTAERLFQYRTKFVQHMLASPMYANCEIGKPWEIIGSISEQLIDDLLSQCAKEMQLQNVVQELYKVETR